MNNNTITTKQINYIKKLDNTFENVEKMTVSEASKLIKKLLNKLNNNKDYKKPVQSKPQK